MSIDEVTVFTPRPSNDAKLMAQGRSYLVKYRIGAKDKVITVSSQWLADFEKYQKQQSFSFDQSHKCRVVSEEGKTWVRLVDSPDGSPYVNLNTARFKDLGCVELESEDVEI